MSEQNQIPSGQEAKLDAKVAEILGRNPDLDLDPGKLREKLASSWVVDGEVAFEEALSRAKINQRVARVLAADAYRGTKLVDWDDYLTFRDDAWLVPDLIGRGSMNLLVAKATTGKTFLSIALICSAALGRDWLGREIAKFKTLIYLSEGVPNYMLRYRAWAEANGVDINVLKDSIRVYSGANLSSAVFQEKLVEEVAEFQPDLVVFDTFSGTSGVRDENDAAIVAALLEETRISASGAAVLLIHHPNKGSENTSSLDLRGSGTLKNNVDAVLALYPDKSFNGEHDGQYVALSTEPGRGGKIKDSTPTTIRGLYISGVDLGYTPKGAKVSSAVMAQDMRPTMSKADEAVLEYLPPHPIAATDFAKAAGVSRATGFRYLRESRLAENTGTGWQLAEPVDVDESEIFAD